MSRFSADTRLGSTPVFAVLCGAFLVAQAHADEHELTPTVITAIAPSSYISPETYDKLTVIKGPQTVLWGPDASAGTMLFEREPEQFGELGTRVNASVLAGNAGFGYPFNDPQAIKEPGRTLWTKVDMSF